MLNDIKAFTNSAKELSRNPLGIIALFIVLVYGFACILFGFSAKVLTIAERSPLIWFTVLFPVLVLIIFAWLVTKHPHKLYSPRDFRDDKAYLTALKENQSNPTKTNESSAEIKELMKYGAGLKVIEIQEKAIRDDLDKRNLDHSDSTVKMLIRQLAGSHILRWFEKTYSAIFGSQITLLKLLNEKSLSYSHSDISSYFEKVKKQYPTEYESWNVDSYLRYLLNSQLIDNKDERITVTETGREFLSLIIQAGYTESKRL